MTTQTTTQTNTAPAQRSKGFLGKSYRFWRETVTGWVMVSPWVIGFLGLTLVPMVLSLYFTFTHFDGATWPPTWAGLYNFKFLLKDIRYHKAVYNTLYYAMLSQPLVIVGSLFLAILLNQRVPGKTAFRTIYYLPAVLSEVPRAMLWLWLLNPRLGLINQGLRAIGISQPPNWLYDASWAKPAMVLMRMWGLGTSAVIFLAALQSVPDHLLEAAEVDGASRWQRFWYVMLPMLSPAIFFQIVTGLIAVFQIFGAIYVWSTHVGGTTAAGPQDSLLFYAYYLYQVAFEDFRMGRASAMAWILFIFILLLTIVQFRLARHWVYYEAGGDSV